MVKEFFKTNHYIRMIFENRCFSSGQGVVQTELKLVCEITLSIKSKSERFPSIACLGKAWGYFIPFWIFLK